MHNVNNETFFWVMNKTFVFFFCKLFCHNPNNNNSYVDSNILTFTVFAIHPLGFMSKFFLVIVLLYMFLLDVFVAGLHLRDLPQGSEGSSGLLPSDHCCVWELVTLHLG